MSPKTPKKNVIFPPIRYFGGKSRIAPFIRPYIPPMTDHFQIWVEVFFGTGGLFFNLLQIPKSATINDKDDLIYNFWFVFKHHLAEFEKELELVWCGEMWFNEYKNRDDPVGKAVYFYLLNKNNHSGTTKEEWHERFLINPFHKTFDQIKTIMNQIQYLTIWRDDFRDVLQHLKGRGYSDERANTFYIYEDPPYYKEGHRYRVSFTEQDHIDLWHHNNQLKDESNKWIFLSYDDCDWVHEHYNEKNGWYVKTLHLDIISKGYTELLISNRPLKEYHKKKIKTIDISQY